MSDKLKSCPFCNSNQVKIMQEDECYYAQCNCGICTVVCDSEEAVKLIWNRRIEWFSRIIRPEEDKKIIVKNNKGKEYDKHYWNGHCYYEYCGNDGYPSDRDIVYLRYKDSK